MKPPPPGLMGVKDMTLDHVSGGRLEINAYLREVFRESGKLGSVYDSNVTSWDPYPFAPDQHR